MAKRIKTQKRRKGYRRSKRISLRKGGIGSPLHLDPREMIKKRMKEGVRTRKMADRANSESFYGTRRTSRLTRPSTNIRRIVEDIIQEEEF